MKQMWRPCQFFSISLPAGYQLQIADEKAILWGKRPRRQMTISCGLAGCLQKLLQNDIDYACNQAEAAALFTLAAKGYLQITNKAEDCLTLGENVPLVSVIIPVKDRPEDIRDCLTSIFQIQWPKEKLEVIVVDDGSQDDTPMVAEALGAKVIRRQQSGGPSIARNLGAKAAQGEILAFLDSDCTVDAGWFLELIPWLLAPGIGGVGGFVASYYRTSQLDRYEEAMSSLSMGKRLLYEAAGEGNFYVPTCNLLVKKTVYEEMNGLNPEMHLGEDVDFCWRMRSAGYGLLYVTVGRAWHKHRNVLGQMLKRRMQYGTSEADLYGRHRDKKKRFPLPLAAVLFYLGILLTILFWQPLCLSCSVAGLIWSFFRKRHLARKLRQPMGCRELIGVSWRSACAFCYYLNFHIIRYYLILCCLLACFFPSLWLVIFIMLISCGLVDYFIKKPNMNFLSFLFFYLLEQIYYQIGVLLGCFQHHYFCCYRVHWLVSI